MKKGYADLLDDRIWTGEFFPPDGYADRFAGTLKYTPDKGVQLRYRVTGERIKQEFPLVHAVLDSGQKATLVGRFAMPAAQLPTIDQGLMSYSGQAGFSCLLLGDFVAPEAGWRSVAFTLTLMQEFFFPEGYKGWQRYHPEPLLTLSLDGRQIEVASHATFDFAAPDLTTHFYSTNPQLIERLRDCVGQVRQEFTKDYLMLKKDFRYDVIIRYDKPQGCDAAYQDIQRLADFFAVLMYRPVYLQWIEAQSADETYPDGRLRVYPSMLIDPRTLGLCRRETSHFHLPITAHRIDLEAVMRTWWSAADRFDVMGSSLQHETGLQNRHAIHGDLVLFASVLDGISHADKIPGNQKYLYPIEEHAALIIVPAKTL